jgi:hypothetical protein
MKKIVFVLMLMFVSLFASDRVVRIDTVLIQGRSVSNRQMAMDAAELEVIKQIGDDQTTQYIRSTTTLNTKNVNGKATEKFNRDVRVRSIFAIDVVRTEIIDIRNRNYVVRVITAIDTTAFNQVMYDIHNAELERNEILQRDLDRANQRQQRRDEVYKEIMVIVDDAQKDIKDWQENSTRRTAEAAKRNNSLSILGDNMDGLNDDNSPFDARKNTDGSWGNWNINGRNWFEMIMVKEQRARFNSLPRGYGIVVAENKLNLRSCVKIDTRDYMEDGSCPPIKALNRGDVIYILGIAGQDKNSTDWLKVRHEDNIGFVNSNFILWK